MARYSVRNLRSSDFETLMSIEEKMFGDDHTGTLGPYYVRLCCDFFSETCFLAEAADGSMVGYLLAFFKGREAYCTTLALLPEFQGSRAILPLLRAFITSVADRADVCWFTVEPENHAARSLHKTLGAKEVDKVLEFYGPDQPRSVSMIDREGFEKLKSRFVKLGLVETGANDSEAIPPRTFRASA